MTRSMLPFITEVLFFDRKASAPPVVVIPAKAGILKDTSPDQTPSPPIIPFERTTGGAVPSLRMLICRGGRSL